MAWTCVRCLKKIFAPRRGAFKYAMEWRYIKVRSELLCELSKLSDLKEDSIITHLSCDLSEVDGFNDRMKERLKMPADASHPLLV